MNIDNIDFTKVDELAAKIVELVNAGEIKDGDVWIRLSDPGGRVAEIKVVRSILGAAATVTKNF